MELCNGASDQWLALWLSVKVGLCCALVVAVPGTACGWLLARRSFPGKPILDSLVHLPLVLPPVVIGYGLLVLLGRRGVLGEWLLRLFGAELAFTWKAAVLASAVVAFPLVVRSVRVAVELVDPRLEDAAATLGAGPWQRFCTITLPLASPGILCGVVLAFARSLGEFGATITFAGNLGGETRTLPLALYTAMQSPGGDVRAAQLAGLSAAVAVAAMIASELMNRQMQKRRPMEGAA